MSAIDASRSVRVRKVVGFLAVLLLVVLVGLWRASIGEADAPVAPARDAGVRLATEPPTTNLAHVVAPAPQLGGGHPPTPLLDGVDPCWPVAEVNIPETFEQKTIGNITVAWRNDSDATFSANMIGRVAQGILEDAAEATGTPRRDHLTIIVYSSTGEMIAQTHAPSWAGGVYDGAVNVAAASYHDLGVSLEVLRHEIMHAQLHAAVGCMPAWFNEGIARYFERAGEMHELLALLRDRDLFDVDSLSTSAIQDLPTRSYSKLYAQSLVMVTYALAHGDGELHTFVEHYRGLPEAQRAHVYERWFPEAHAQQLLDHLARTVFGMPTGTELDALLHGPVCCSGRDITKLKCRAPIQAKAEPMWIERTGGAVARCESSF